MDDLDRFLADETQKHRRYYRTEQLAMWDAEVHGTDEAFAAFERVQNERNAAYADPATYERINRHLERPDLDPDTHRQLSVLRLQYLDGQGDPGLQRRITAAETVVMQKFNTFRATADGVTYTDNDIDKIMVSSRDSAELQKVWEASKRQGALVEKDVLALVRLRNEYARGIGFPDYYAFALALQEQTRDEVTALFDDLHAQTKESSARMLADLNDHLAGLHGMSPAELRPWHYQDLFFQEAPRVYDVDLDAYYTKDAVEIARKFFAGIGLPIDDILQRSSLYEQEGKSQHASCNDMDREGDVRALCNMRNNERWLSTLLHECGHGVYWTHMDRTIPYLLRTDAHTLVTEAIAIMFESFSADPRFIRTVVDEKGIDSLARCLRDRRRAQLLIFANWSQVMVRFEQELYANPEQDLNARWWSLVREYQGLDFSRDEPDWASKIHLATVPVYYHNYQFGHLLGTQLIHAMHEAGIGDIVGNPETGAFLKRRLFDFGCRYRWDETVERATGERLTTKYWSAELE